MKKDTFAVKYRDDAILVGLACDFPPIILLVQSALETGWGEHIHANNMFGIKDVPWLYGSSKAKTLEWENGKFVPGVKSFENFDSPLQSMLAYIVLIRTLKRYQFAWKCRHCPTGYFRAIHEAGYATDPKYSDKLISIYKNFPIHLVEGR